jgi:predicted PurR-regulated permease PerM
MVFDNKEITRFWTIASILILGTLVFLLVRPVLISIVAGLVLAYVFIPVYRWFLKIVRYKALSATIVLILLGAIIIVPIWYILPTAINQFFDIFRLSQSIDITGFIQSLFPTASLDFVRQAGITSAALLNKASATVLDSMVSFFSEAPVLIMNILVVGFVFFFGLRDNEDLIKIAKEISPLNKVKEQLLIQQFKDITDSIIYGQFVIGIAQGLLAGIGFLIFGVDKAILLTIMTMFFSVIPILGPYVVYIPVAITIFASGDTSSGIAYLIYNLAIVSTLDNFLRTYIVSKKTKMNSAVVFIGMIAGLFMFGIIGLLIGPLILAYFLILIQLYKEKNLSSLFVREEPVPEPEKK